MINIFFLFAKLNLLFLSFFGDPYEVSHITSSQNPIIYCNDIIVPTNLDGCEGVFNLMASAMNGGLCTNGEVLQWLLALEENIVMVGMIAAMLIMVAKLPKFVTLGMTQIFKI